MASPMVWLFWALMERVQFTDIHCFDSTSDGFVFDHESLLINFQGRPFDCVGSEFDYSILAWSNWVFITATRQIHPHRHLPWNSLFWFFGFSFRPSCIFYSIDRFLVGLLVGWFQHFWVFSISDEGLLGRQSPIWSWLDHCHCSPVGIYFQLEKGELTNFEILSGLFFYLSRYGSFWGEYHHGEGLLS